MAAKYEWRTIFLRMTVYSLRALSYHFWDKHVLVFYVKIDDTHNVLLLGVWGHLNVWHLSMASYIYMQKLSSVYSTEK